jgi:Transposase IS66 family/Transposase C of IS166 homeodomain
VPNVASLPIPTLQQLVIEQQHMIETLKEQLHLALRRQFGPRNEYVDVDQLGLFGGDAERSTVIELSIAAAEDEEERKAEASTTQGNAAVERKKAVRILKDLPREIRIVDIPEADKQCSCCGEALHHFGEECSEHLGLRQIRPLSDEERRQQRQAQSVPVLQAFKAWLDIQAHAVLPKSALGRAVFYALKNWDVLCRYTAEGYLEPDSNYAEQSLRPVAVGRKAFLFVGSERAGRAAAIYYSLVESCKLNKVNPLTYLTLCLEPCARQARDFADAR